MKSFTGVLVYLTIVFAVCEGAAQHKRSANTEAFLRVLAETLNKRDETTASPLAAMGKNIAGVMGNVTKAFTGGKRAKDDTTASPLVAVGQNIAGVMGNVTKAFTGGKRAEGDSDSAANAIQNVTNANAQLANAGVKLASNAANELLGKRADATTAGPTDETVNQMASAGADAVNGILKSVTKIFAGNSGGDSKRAVDLIAELMEEYERVSKRAATTMNPVADSVLEAGKAAGQMSDTLTDQSDKILKSMTSVDFDSKKMTDDALDIVDEVLALVLNLAETALGKNTATTTKRADDPTIDSKDPLERIVARIAKFINNNIDAIRGFLKSSGIGPLFKSLMPIISPLMPKTADAGSS